MDIYFHMFIIKQFSRQNDTQIEGKKKMQINANNDNIMTEGHKNGGFMSLIRKH